MCQSAFRVLIVAHFTGDGPSGNNRFHDLARRFAARGCEVEVVTSDFSHGAKSFRPAVCQKGDYVLTQIHESGYRLNVSMRRIWSHGVFARNLRKYLRNSAGADLVYCGIPSLGAGIEAARAAKRSGAALIIDVQDLWPEAFGMVIPRWLLRVLGITARRKARRIYDSADALIAVSRTYSDHALGASREPKATLVAYLGTDLASFDSHVVDAARKTPACGAFVVGYAGTLGWSYDLKLVFQAVRVAQMASRRPFSLLIMGDGPRRGEFEAEARACGVEAEFTGRLAYADMARRLSECDAVVNPISGGSAASVINKVCDYAASGVPVINSQESPEYRALLEEYGAGLNCVNGDAEDFAKKLLLLSSDEELRARLGRGNRKMAESLFDRSKTYERIVDFALDVNGGSERVVA